MNTITDELIQACIAAWFETPGEMTTRMGAVLALAESKQAAALADLRRWKSTHAPRIEALQGLLETAQREAAEGTEARSTLSSEREANTILTAEIELLRARIAELEATQCGRIAKLVHAAYFELQRYEYINATVKLRDAVAELEAQAAQPAKGQSHDALSALRQAAKHIREVVSLTDGTEYREAVEAGDRVREAIASLEAAQPAQAPAHIQARVDRLLGTQTAAPSLPPVMVPDILFDGYAVLQALSEQAKRRTSAQNVSDVLDAVVRVMRAAPKPAQVAAPEGWQPIETAPKDGTVVLVFDGQFVGTALFSAWERDERGLVIGLEPEDTNPPDCWEWTGDGSEVGPTPTHWMPLPAAPKRDGGFLAQIDKARASVESWPDALKGGVRDVLEGGEHV
jgi:biotin carboxyl carrier protein